LSAITERWTLEVEIQPATDRAAADAAHQTWLRAVERSRGWAQ